LNEKYPEAIFFDLDDTLITDDTGSEGIWDDLCFRYALYLETVTGQQLLQAIQSARTWYWSDTERHRQGRLDLSKARYEVIAAAFSSLNIRDDTLAGRMALEYSHLKEARISPMPGAFETLEFLYKEDIKLALITNGASAMQRSKINRFDLGAYFQTIVIEGEFGCGKPDVSVFFHAMHQVNAAAETTWMVGNDLSRDVQGANDAGIFSIWVDIHGTGLQVHHQSRPDRIIRGVSELMSHSKS